MGTRLDETMGGCFAKALPGEIMFVLLARDPHMPDLIEKWAQQRELEIRCGERPESDREQVAEARRCIERAKAWRIENEGRWRDPTQQSPGPLTIAVQVLMDIACYGDKAANDRLAATGSYGLFDEPHAVEAARKAIDAIGGAPPVRP